MCSPSYYRSLNDSLISEWSVWIITYRITKQMGISRRIREIISPVILVHPRSFKKNSDRISGCQRFPIFIDYHHRVVLRQTPSCPLSNGLHMWARLLPYLPAKWQIPTPYYSCNVEVDRLTIHQNRYNSYAQPSANHYAKNPDQPHVHIEKPTELFCAKATSPP